MKADTSSTANGAFIQVKFSASGVVGTFAGYADDNGGGAEASFTTGPTNVITEYWNASGGLTYQDGMGGSPSGVVNTTYQPKLTNTTYGTAGTQMPSS